jgi:hypothetical protein
MKTDMEKEDVQKVFDEFMGYLSRITDKTYTADLAHKLKIPFELSLFIQYAISECLHNGAKKDLEYLSKKYLRRLKKQDMKDVGI